MVSYYDPPYVQSAERSYKQNAGNEDLANILSNFAEPKKLAEMYRPLVDATSIMTNDINGPYITAMRKLYGDRM